MEKNSKTPVDVEVKKTEVEKSVKQAGMTGAELYARLRLGI